MSFVAMTEIFWRTIFHGMFHDYFRHKPSPLIVCLARFVFEALISHSAHAARPRRRTMPGEFLRRHDILRSSALFIAVEII